MRPARTRLQRSWLAAVRPTPLEAPQQQILSIRRVNTFSRQQLQRSWRRGDSFRAKVLIRVDLRRSRPGKLARVPRLPPLETLAMHQTQAAPATVVVLAAPVELEDKATAPPSGNRIQPRRAISPFPLPRSQLETPRRTLSIQHQYPMRATKPVSWQ